MQSNPAPFTRAALKPEHGRVSFQGILPAGRPPHLNNFTVGGTKLLRSQVHGDLPGSEPALLLH